MTSTGAAGAPVLDVIPLGGLGEFGMNMMLVACGDTAVLIDAGVMFPEPELFGVDLVIPDLDVLDPYKGRIRALVLTHGHEDHIGAVPHVIDRIDGPVHEVHTCARPAEARGTRHRRGGTTGSGGAA
jgi:ribonuclease J